MAISPTELAVIAAILSAVASTAMYLSAKQTAMEKEIPHKRLGIIKKSDDSDGFDRYVDFSKMFAIIIAIFLLCAEHLLNGLVAQTMRSNQNGMNSD